MANQCRFYVDVTYDVTFVSNDVLISLIKTSRQNINETQPLLNQYSLD